mmetsp:Transcript_33223/g.100392  ORF Transcript_33223/g.100392 Transcript_33223/m.100392 type:complete len:274 (+) Transcript_33223:1166-1987(+)
MADLLTYDVFETTPSRYDYGGMGFLAGFVPTILHVYVRFGRWDAILEDEAGLAKLVDSDADFFRYTAAIMHYARGVAHAVKAGQEKKDDLRQAHHIEVAKAEQCALDAEPPFPDSAVLMNNPLNAVLDVARKMLAGELAFRCGPAEGAFLLLQDTIAAEESLVYDEPWGWMQPARHALGALLLEHADNSDADDRQVAAILARAEAVYRADLAHPVVRSLSHPRNVWALAGLAETLERQGKAAHTVQAEFGHVAATADVEVRASCFCRVGAAAE